MQLSTISAEHIRSIEPHIEPAGSSTLRYLGFNVERISLVEAKRRGLQPEWFSKMESGATSQHLLLAVRSVAFGLPSKRKESSPYPLRNSDIVLTLDNKAITKASDFEYISEQQSIPACIFRDGRVLTVEAPTIPAADLDVLSYISFCGTILHKPSLAIRMDIHPIHSQLYIADVQPGSPGELADLPLSAFICAIRGQKVYEMEDFEEVISRIADNQYFDVKLIKSNVLSVIVLKKNAKLFPSYKCSRKSPYSSGEWLTQYIDATLGDNEGLGFKIRDENVDE